MPAGTGLRGKRAGDTEKMVAYLCVCRGQRFIWLRLFMEVALL